MKICICWIFVWRIGNSNSQKNATHTYASARKKNNEVLMELLQKIENTNVSTVFPVLLHFSIKTRPQWMTFIRNHCHRHHQRNHLYRQHLDDHIAMIINRLTNRFAHVCVPLFCYDFCLLYCIVWHKNSKKWHASFAHLLSVLIYYFHSI